MGLATVLRGQQLGRTSACGGAPPCSRQARASRADCRSWLTEGHSHAQDWPGVHPNNSSDQGSNNGVGTEAPSLLDGCFTQTDGSVTVVRRRKKRTCVEASEGSPKGSGAASQRHIVGHQVVHGRQCHPLPQAHHPPGQHHCRQGQPSGCHLQAQSTILSCEVVSRLCCSSVRRWMRSRCFVAWAERWQ